MHITNKVRHDTEVKLGEEIEKNHSLQEMLKLKEETLNKRAQEIDELDRKQIELERQIEAADIKKQTVERAAELLKKTLGDKITGL